jgi:hypothetical protein
LSLDVGLSIDGAGELRPDLTDLLVHKHVDQQSERIDRRHVHQHGDVAALMLFSNLM